MTKLGQGLARLSARRSRGRAPHDAAPAASPEPSAMDVVTVAAAHAELAAPASAAVDPVSVSVLAPADVVASFAGETDDDALAELGDPLAAPDPVDTPNGVASTVSETPAPAAGPAADARSDVALDRNPDTPAFPASPMTSSAPAAPVSAARDVVAPAAHADADGGEASTESVPAARVQRLRQRLAGLARVAGRKRVWMPGAGLAMLSVVGSLSLMLHKASNEKADLRADLEAAQKALRQADASPPRAAPTLPPLSSATPPPEPAPVPVRVADTPAADPDQRIHLARASRNRAPVQMDCDVSDKASVSLTLTACIDAFNRATGP